MAWVHMLQAIYDAFETHRAEGKHHMANYTFYHLQLVNNVDLLCDVWLLIVLFVTTISRSIDDYY